MRGGDIGARPCAASAGGHAADSCPSARQARRRRHGRSVRLAGSISHRRIIAPRLRPRNISNSEPWRASRLCSVRWPSAISPHGNGGSQSIRIRASARIRSHAGPNNGWPRSTVRISTPSTCSIARCEDLRLDHLHAVAVGAEALVADDQRQRDRVDAEDQRPFLGDDVEQAPRCCRLRARRAPRRGSPTPRPNGRGQRRSDPGWLPRSTPSRWRRCATARSSNWITRPIEPECNPDRVNFLWPPRARNYPTNQASLWPASAALDKACWSVRDSQ